MKIAVVLVAFGTLASAQSPEAGRLFEQNCVTCHGKVEKVPGTAALRQMPADVILAALTTGGMREQAQALTVEQKQAIAEYLAGYNLVSEQSADAKRMPNACPGNPPLGDLSAMPAWNGWGADRTNSRFQPASAAKLPADQVSRLKLKWAFGFPGATAVYGQPTVVGGRVFVGVNTGYVYSLDAATGCVYWSFRARSGVRNAISIGPIKGHGSAKFAAYFGDVRANVYAIDAATGAELWRTHVDEHGIAGITGAPSLYEGRLYVPVSSREEQAGVSPAYPCCTFRGSVVALDANTGKQIWKTYTIPETPKPTLKNSAGTQLYGPAGGAIWNSPTIDKKRRALYVGTGNAYTEPAPPRTDSIMALDMDSGKVLWAVQDTPHDSWLVCFDQKTENCPKDMGPDYDFGSSPILRTLPGGKRILVAGQKSGMVLAHDPDQKGALVWKAQLPKQLALGEITYGGAADEQNAYFGLKSGGIAAVQLTTGERTWFAPLEGRVGRGAGGGQTAALSAIPGAVFSGGWDGKLRAFSTENGKPLWEYNMLQEFQTVNGVAAKGGGMGAPGPAIAGGMLFAGSGYVFGANGAPGNVLLAFGAE